MRLMRFKEILWDLFLFFMRGFALMGFDSVDGWNMSGISGIGIFSWHIFFRPSGNHPHNWAIPKPNGGIDGIIQN